MSLTNLQKRDRIKVTSRMPLEKKHTQRRTFMKKILKRIVSVALVCVMVLSLVSCDKSGSVKKAFEKED